MSCRRRPRNDARAHAPLLVTPVRLRNGARRYPRDTRAGGRAGFRTQGAQGSFSNWRGARQADKVPGRWPGRTGQKNQSLRARAYPLRRHRYGAYCADRHRRRDEADFRKGPQSAIRIYRPREADGCRGRLGRGGWRGRQIQRENDETQPRQTAAAGVAYAVLLSRRLAQGECLPA